MIPSILVNKSLGAGLSSYRPAIQLRVLLVPANNHSTTGTRGRDMARISFQIDTLNGSSGLSDRNLVGCELGTFTKAVKWILYALDLSNYWNIDSPSLFDDNSSVGSVYMYMSISEAPVMMHSSHSRSLPGSLPERTNERQPSNRTSN